MSSEIPTKTPYTFAPPRLRDELGLRDEQDPDTNIRTVHYPLEVVTTIFPKHAEIISILSKQLLAETNLTILSLSGSSIN